MFLPSFALLAGLLVASSSRAATTQTWSGGGDDPNWTTTANWASGIAPGSTSSLTNSDIGSFTTSLVNGWGSSSAPVVIDPATLDIGGITFDTFAGAFFIGTTDGNALRLSSGATNTIQIAATLNSTITTETVNAPLILEPATATTAGVYSFQNNASSPTAVLALGGNISGGATTSTVTLTLSGGNTGNNTISGAISNGSASTLAITKSGAGTWVLSGSNSYTGATAISGGGALNIQNDNALGAVGGNTTVASGSALQLQGGITVAGESLTLAGEGQTGNTGALRSVGGDNVWNGNITATTSSVNVRIAANAGSTLTIGGNIAISSNAKSLIFQPDGQINVNGVISGAGVVSVSPISGGYLVLSGANTYTGNTTWSGGTASIQLNNALAGQNSTFVYTQTNGLQFGTVSSTYTIGGLSGGTGGLGLNLQDIASQVVNLQIGNNNASSTFAGQITGSGSITKIGTGNQTFSATNSTYTGPTTIDGGTLTAALVAAGGANSSIGASTSDAANLVFGGGTLTITGTSTTDRLFTIGDANGLTATITSSSNPVVFNGAGALAFGGSGAHTLTLTGTNTGANSFAPIIGDDGSNPTNLVKSGTSVWTLAGANTYSGGTVVSGGSFTVAAAATLGANVADNDLVVANESKVTLNAATNFGANQKVIFQAAGLPTAIAVNGSLPELILNYNGVPTFGAASTQGVVAIGTSFTQSASSFTTPIDESAMGNSFIGSTSNQNNFGVFYGASTLGAGSDGVYRLTGAGGNVLSVSNAVLIDGANNAPQSVLIGVSLFNNAGATNGAGTVVLNGANPYTGTTTVNPGSTLALAGGNGSIKNSTGIFVNSGTLWLQNAPAFGSAGSNNNDRIGDTTGITLNGGTFLFDSNANTNTTETVGGLTLVNNDTITLTSKSSHSGILTAASITRTGTATGLVQGSNLGINSVATTAYTQLLLTNASGLAAIGTQTANTTNGTSNTLNLAIAPWLLADVSATGTGTNFATYDAGVGLRPLSATETVQLSALSTGITDDQNVKDTSTTAVGLATGPYIANSINLAPGAAIAYTGVAGTTLNSTSGALALTTSFSTTLTGIDSITLGTNGNPEGIIQVGSSSATLTIASPINAGLNYGLTKGGAGNLTLSADNTFTGQIVVNAGKLTLSGNGTQSGITINGGKLAMGASSASTATAWGGSNADININSGGTLAVDNGSTAVNNVYGGGNIYLNDGGTISLTGGSGNKYEFLNPVIVSGNGQISQDSGAGSNNKAFIGPVTLNANAILTVYRQLVSGMVNGFGTGVVTLNGNATVNYIPRIADNQHPMNIAQIVGSGDFTKAGAGELWLADSNYNQSFAVAAASTYSGDTHVEGGKLRLGVTNTLPTNTTVYINSGAYLDFSVGGFQYDADQNHSQSFAGLNDGSTGGGTVVGQTDTSGGTGGIGSVAMTLTGSGNYAFSGSIIDQTTGTATMAVAKTGTGVQTFSGASSYSGGTTISGGTLLVNNAAGSGTGSGNVTVASTGTLGGIGAIAGSITVSGGHLAPGNLVAGVQTIGTLTTSGTLTLNTATNLDFVFDGAQPGASNAAPGVSSTVALLSSANGALVFPGTGGGSVTLNAIGAFPNVAGGSTAYYELFSYANGDNNTVANFVGQTGFTLLQQNSANSIQLGAGFAFANPAYTYTLINDPLLKGIFLDIANGSTGPAIGNGTWTNSSGDYQWTTNANWTPAQPSGPGLTATFNGSEANQGSPILLSSDQTIGALILSGANYTIGQNAFHALNLDNTGGSGNAQITVNGNNQLIVAPVISSNTDLDITTTAGSLNLQGGLTIMSGRTTNLHQSGSSSLGIGDVTNNGTLNAATGSSTAGAISGSGSTTLAANAKLVANQFVQGSLTVHGDSSHTTAKATVAVSGMNSAGDPNQVSVLNSLSIDNDGAALGSRNYYGTVDLKNNDLIVNNANSGAATATLASVADMARAGQSGNGLMTSSGDTITGLGVINNTNGLTSFDNVSIDSNATLVKYTFFGDLNLDGKVDGNEIAAAVNGFNLHLGGWANGDANYSGQVDGNDIAAIVNAFNGQNGHNAPLPEPSTLVLAGLGLLGLLFARQRRSK